MSTTTVHHQNNISKNTTVWTALIRYVRLGSALGTNPYQFEPSLNKFILTKSNWQLKIYLYMSLYMFLDNVYLTFALHYTKHLNLIDFLKDYTHWISRSSSSFINIVQLIIVYKYAHLLNSFINLDKFQGGLACMSNNNNSNQKYIYNVITVMTLVTIFQPIGPINAFIQDAPAVRYWHSSVPILIECLPRPVYYTLFAVLEYWVSFHAVYVWCLIGFGIIISSSGIKQLLCTLSSETTANNFNPSHTRIYRTLQLLSQRSNECFSTYVWTFGQASGLLAHILMNSATILLFRNGQMQFIGTLVGSLVLTWAPTFIFDTAALIHEISTEFGRKHSMRNMAIVGKKARIMMRQYGRSCAPIFVPVGSYYYLRRISILGYLHVVVNYTVTYLLLDIQ